MSYYSLPSIKCNERKNIMTNVFSSNTDKCLNPNPNNVYNSLYPNFNKPLTKFNNQNGIGVNNVGEYSNISKNKCASECLLNNASKKSNYFSYDDNIQTCSLYEAENPESINTNQSDVDSYLYKKKSSSGCNNTDPECSGCQTFCVTNGSDNFEKIGTNINVINHDSKIADYAVNTLDNCKDKCNNNSNCKSFLYKNIQSKCKLYKNKINSNSNIIYKMKDNLGNKISMDYLPYYQSYQEGNNDYKGKTGDYTCGYSDSECYEISQKECNSNNCNTQEETAEQEINKIYDYPLNNISNNNIALSSTNGKVSINGFKFDKCLSNTGNSCIGPIYTNDDSGFPKRDRTPNPPTQDYMIRKSFEKQKNKNFINCPTGWTPNTDKNKCIKTSGTSTTFQICTPNNIENTDRIAKCRYTNDNALIKRRPKLDAFSSVYGCKRWCNNNRDCEGISSTINKGNTECLYYNDNMFNNRSNFVSSDNHTVYTKKTQEDDYIHNVKNYTKSLVDNNIPLTPNLNQILNPDDHSCDNNYFNFTKCISDSNIGSDLIKLSEKCQNQFGKGYVADEHAIEGKKSCNQSGYSRYRCNLNPAINPNAENINLRPKLNEYFGNSGDTNNQDSGFSSICFNIFIFIAVILVIFIIRKNLN